MTANDTSGLLRTRERAGAEREQGKQHEPCLDRPDPARFGDGRCRCPRRGDDIASRVGRDDARIGGSRSRDARLRPGERMREGDARPRDRRRRVDHPRRGARRRDDAGLRTDDPRLVCGSSRGSHRKRGANAEPADGRGRRRIGDGRARR